MTCDGCGEACAPDRDLFQREDYPGVTGPDGAYRAPWLCSDCLGGCENCGETAEDPVYFYVPPSYRLRRFCRKTREKDCAREHADRYFEQNFPVRTKRKRLSDEQEPRFRHPPPREKGAIMPETLDRLQRSLRAMGYEYHLAVEVSVHASLKTVDNEADARETIARIERKLEQKF